jgi:hypothetical protein
MEMQFVRHRPHLEGVHSGKTEVCSAHKYRAGQYVIADPSVGPNRHHSKHQLTISTAHEVELNLKKGFMFRMKGNLSDQVNLISANKIEVRK